MTLDDTLQPPGERPGPRHDSGSRRIGDYAVESELARGGMGVVYVARHLPTGRRVALKQILSRASKQASARFMTEAQALAQLRHPNIVAVHELGQDSSGPFMVMELIEGSSLKDHIKGEGILDAREAAALTLTLAGALEHAHERSILHRDLKPANVLLDREGRPLLTDFGLARDMSQEKERLTRTGQMIGTPAFMAPEQAGGDLERIDQRSDVYGLGATLYAMLAGRPPFVGESALNVVARVLAIPPDPVSELHPGLDPDLETICLKCLAKRPAQRYGSASDLAADLERYLRGEPISGRRPVSGRRWPLVVAAVLLLAAIALGIVAATGAPPDETPLAHVEEGEDDDPQPGSEPEPEKQEDPNPHPDVVTLVAQLESPAREERRDAAKRLGAINTRHAPSVAAAVAGLRAAVLEKEARDHVLDGHCIRALIHLGADSALLEALQHVALSVRKATLRQLRAHGKPVDGPILDTILDMVRRDRDPTTRSEAMRTLARLSAPLDRAASPLLDQLLNGGRYQRQVAARALAGLGYRDPRSIPSLVQVLGQQSMTDPAAAMLARIGEQAVPALRAALRQSSPKTSRRDIMKALAWLGPVAGPASMDVERVLSEDPDPLVRKRAAQTLAVIGRPEALPALIEALGDDDPRVRAAAARALGQLGAVEAVPLLVEKLRDPKLGTVAAIALAHIGERAVGPLVALLDPKTFLGEGHDAQRRVVFALGSMKPGVARAAFEPLRRIGAKSPSLRPLIGVAMWIIQSDSREHGALHGHHGWRSVRVYPPRGRLTRIDVWSDGEALRFVWEKGFEGQVLGPERRSEPTSFELQTDEYVVAISGKLGVSVRVLTVHTNKRELRLGNWSGTRFRIDAPAGHEIAGLRGREDSKGLLCQIGVIVRPRRP